MTDLQTDAPEIAPFPQPSLDRLTGLGVAGVGIAALLANYGLRTGVSSLSSSFAALVLLTGLSRAATTKTLAAAGIATVFAVLLPLRASEWLTGLNTLALVASIAAVALMGSGMKPALSTSTVAEAFVRGVQAVFGPLILVRSLAPRRPGMVQRVAAVARAAAIAAVPFFLFAALLASADTVFADLIQIDFDLSAPIEHGFVVVALAIGISGTIAVVRSTAPARPAGRTGPLGPTEAAVTLGAVAVLFGAFAIVQLYSALGRADEILARQGVTYAEYARSGFFQLLWVAALTLVLLAMVRMLRRDTSGPIDRVVRALGAAVSLLTCLIVVTAIVRLDLYTREFGQTPLRWYCTAFAAMLGVVFVLIAVGHAQRLHRHLGSSLVATVVTTLVIVNLINPDARIAEHNLGRAELGESLDAEFLLGLSADAWPILLDHRGLIETRLALDRPGTDAAERFDRACRAADDDRGFGVLGFNVALARLDCGTG